MPVKVKTEVAGLRELEKALRDLPIEMVGGGTLGKNPLRKGTQMAVKNLLLPAVKARAPVGTGALRDNIQMAITNARTRNAALRGGSSFEGYVVGVKDTYNTDAKPSGRHKHLPGVPLGAYAYVQEGWKGKNAPYAIRPKKFLRGALYMTSSGMVSVFTTEMRAAIERIRKKIAAKSPRK